jgi:hypothetical protein
MTDRSTAQTVTIIGAGIGGLYLVAELGIAGFKLRLHDIDDSRLSEIQARGGVDVEGERGGFAAVERTTTDLTSALDGIWFLNQMLRKSGNKRPTNQPTRMLGRRRPTGHISRARRREPGDAFPGIA